MYILFKKEVSVYMTSERILLPTLLDHTLVRLKSVSWGLGVDGKHRKTTINLNKTRNETRQRQFKT